MKAKLTTTVALFAVFAGSSVCATSTFAETIEYCDGLYRYIDREFMSIRASKGCMGSRWPRQGEALGYTLSSTPPDAAVEFIEEHFTVCVGVGPEVERIVSRDRRVPRYRVTGKPYEFGNYIRYQAGRTSPCRSVEYRPPATARRPAPEAIERHAPIVFGPMIAGTARATWSAANLTVNRQSIQLYGVVPNRAQRDVDRQRALAQQIYNNRQVSCREVDLGGYQCLLDGTDLSVLFASRGMVVPHSSATQRIRDASAGPPQSLPSEAQTPAPSPPGVTRSSPSRCEELAALAERYESRRGDSPAYESRAIRARERHDALCAPR